MSRLRQSKGSLKGKQMLAVCTSGVCTPPGGSDRPVLGKHTLDFQDLMQFTLESANLVLVLIRSPNWRLVNGFLGSLPLRKECNFPSDVLL